MRYDVFRKQLEFAVLNTPGDSPTALRRAAMQRGTIPTPLASYVDKVARHAHKVTDADVAELRDSYSDDALFEITVAAAVGAALHRLDRGMAALRGEEPD
jgi:alkylhydroperoxidase family enzyme